MVLLVIKTWYPGHKGPEVAEMFQKVQKEFPESESVSELLAFGALPTEDGFEVMVVRKVTLEKLGEAMIRANTMLLNYMPIEGYKYTLNVWADVTETPPAG